MRRPEFFCDLGVILRPGIFIANQNSDRRAERFAFEDSRKNFATIFLLTLGGDFTLPGTSPIQLALNVGFGDVDLGRTTIDHNADAAAVRFAERRDAKELSESVAH